jgi:hypothetical protein
MPTAITVGKGTIVTLNISITIDTVVVAAGS